MTTTNDIDAIRQRTQAATPGPWWSDDSEQSWRLHGVAFRLPPPWKGAPEQVVNKQILKAPKASEQFEPYWPDAADAEFIAHARTDVPALLAKVDELTNRVSVYAVELADVWEHLTAANRRNDGLQADLDSATKANTAWANQVAAKDAVIDAAKRWAECCDHVIDDTRQREDALYNAVKALPSEVAR